MTRDLTKTVKEPQREDIRTTLQFQIGLLFKGLVRKLNNELTRERVPVMAEQVPVLLIVYFHGKPMTQTDIATLAQRDRASIQRSVQVLQKDGFLAIESDILDKRKSVITLTTSGRYIAEKIQSMVVTFNEQILNTLAPDEAATLFRLLNKVALLVED